MLFKSFIQNIFEGIHVFTPEGEYINKPLQEFLEDLYYGRKIIIKPNDVVQVKPNERKYWFISFIGKEFEEHGEKKTIDVLQMNFTNNHGYNTPIGLYSYPLEYSKIYIDEQESWPYATDGNTCVGFRISKKAFKNVWTTTSFTEKVYNKKVKKLIDIICDNYKEKVTNHLIKVKLLNDKEQVKDDEKFKIILKKYIKSLSENIITDMKEKYIGYEKLKEQEYSDKTHDELIYECYLGQFFYLIYNLFSYDYTNILDRKTPKLDSKEYKQYPALYTKILKELDCNGVIDDGYGFIHPNEPIQAVFFSATKHGLFERQLYASNDLYKKITSKDEIEHNITKSKHYKKSKKEFKINDINISQYELYNFNYSQDNIMNYIDIENKIIHNLCFKKCVVNKCDYKFVKCKFKNVIAHGITFEKCDFIDNKCEFTDCDIIEGSATSNNNKLNHCIIQHLDKNQYIFFTSSYFNECNIKLLTDYKRFKISKNNFKNCDLYLELLGGNYLICDYLTNMKNTKISSNNKLEIRYNLNMVNNPFIENFTANDYEQCIQRMDIQCDNIEKLDISLHSEKFGKHSSITINLPYKTLDNNIINKISNPDNFTKIKNVLTEYKEENIADLEQKLENIF